MSRLGFLTHKILFILFILSKFKAAARGLMKTGFRWLKRYLLRIKGAFM